MEDFVRKCACTVFSTLGPGHSEAVYHSAMDVLFRSIHVPYASEVVVPITFMGKGIGFHRLDTVLYSDEPSGSDGGGPPVTGYGVVILEYKSISKLREQEENQVRAYLRTTGYAYGILVNFGGSGGGVETRRVDLDCAPPA